MFQKIQEIVSVILGLRKFIIMAALIAVAIIFRIKNLIDGTNMVDLLKATAVAFMASNSVEHIKSMVTSYIDSKTGKKVEEIESTAGDTNASQN